MVTKQVGKLGVASNDLRFPMSEIVGVRRFVERISPQRFRHRNRQSAAIFHRRDQKGSRIIHVPNMALLAGRA